MSGSIASSRQITASLETVELAPNPNPLHRNPVPLQNAPRLPQHRFPLNPDGPRNAPSLNPNLPHRPSPLAQNRQRLPKLLLLAAMQFSAKQSASRWPAPTRMPRSANKAHAAHAFSISVSEASLSNLTHRKISRRTCWPYSMSPFFRL